MSVELLAPLAVLALIDSTSFGTLLIPIWLMLAPGRLRAGRVLVFLGTVAVFYLGVGIALLAGADGLLTALDGDSPLLLQGQLVLGVALFVGSFFVGRKKPGDGAPAAADGGSPLPVGGAHGVSPAGAPAPTPAQGAVRTGERAPSGRLARWRERTLTAEGRGGYLALMGLALGAALLEVASMLPYLGAIGMLSTSDVAGPTRLLVLAAYCVVMILPALVLLGARILARRLVEPVLVRISDWMARSSGETIAWIMGIAGFFIARDAGARLGLFEAIGVTIG